MLKKKNLVQLFTLPDILILKMKGFIFECYLLKNHIRVFLYSIIIDKITKLNI